MPEPAVRTIRAVLNARALMGVPRGGCARCGC
jgi:hypothetical protein